MASATTVVITAASPTTTAGNVSYTSSGFGTPSAAIVYFRLEEGANRSFSVGFYDGTDSRVQAVYAENAVSPSNSVRMSGTAICAANSASAATVTGWVTDGIRINWASIPAGGVITIILFGGLVSAKVLSVLVGAVPLDINTIGFEPHLTFLACGGNATEDSYTSAHGIFSLGVVHNDGAGGITQGCALVSDNDGQTTVVANALTVNNNCIGQIWNDATTWLAAASAFDSSGFTLTPDVDASDYVTIFALEFNDSGDADVGFFTTPTTAVQTDHTPLAFTPQAVGVIGSWCPTINTREDGANAFSITASLTDGTVEHGIMMENEDGQNPSDVDTVDVSTIVSQRAPTGNSTGAIVGPLNSFISGGIRVDYSGVDTTARQQILWGINDTPAAGTLLPQIMHYNRMRTV